MANSVKFSVNQSIHAIKCVFAIRFELLILKEVAFGLRSRKVENQQQQLTTRPPSRRWGNLATLAQLSAEKSLRTKELKKFEKNCGAFLFSLFLETV